ncbi:MAG: family 78 glycoside hydrolase catalytic domain [Candidatus Omnitrophota bacterium]
MNMKSVIYPPDGLRNARWIWTGDDPGESNIWIYARCSFDVQNPAGARIDITADLRYFLWVNGRPVGFGPPKFHWEMPTFDRYQIESNLAAGANTIAVLVYSYGSSGKISSCMPKRGALRACIYCDEKEIISDHSWRVCRERAYAAKTINRDEIQPPVECFDARLALGEPWKIDFDDSAWSYATELPELMPPENLELRDIPLFGWNTHEPDRCLATGIARFNAALDSGEMTGLPGQIVSARRMADNQGLVSIEPGLSGRSDRWTLDASSLPASDGCYALWDFGRIWTGYPIIELSGTPGTVVDISYAEHLRRGAIDPTKHLSYVDRLILGKGTLRHRITWPKCFRYMQIDVRGGRATVESAALQRSTYPVQWTGRFACSDPTLDQAWEISAHTVQLCMEDGYMDTPWRERGSWLGDDVIKALANYYVFGDTALMRRFLRQHARGQLSSGAMQSKYPSCKSSHVSTWTLTYAVSVRDYIRYTGDRELGRELWPTIQRIAGWLETYRLPEGVYGNLPVEVSAETNIYNFIDWAPVDTRGANAAWNAHAYHFLSAAASVAAAAGEPSAAESLLERAGALKRNFQTLFWDAGRGVFVNGWHQGKQLRRWGCQENYLAVLFGLTTDAQRNSIMKRLQQENLFSVFIPDRRDYDIIIPESGDANSGVAIALSRYRWDDEKMVPLGTPYFASFALEAMYELGMTDEALDFIRLRWGDFSRQGATTVWEVWNRENGSLSHGWACAPAFVLGRYVIGIAPSDDSMADYMVLPQRGNLTWARGRIPTPKGVIDVMWEYDGKWRLEISLPAGASALAGLPLSDGQSLFFDGNMVIRPERYLRFGQSYQAVPVLEGTHVLSS